MTGAERVLVQRLDGRQFVVRLASYLRRPNGVVLDPETFEPLDDYVEKVRLRAVEPWSLTYHDGTVKDYAPGDELALPLDAWLQMEAARAAQGADEVAEVVEVITNGEAPLTKADDVIPGIAGRPPVTLAAAVEFLRERVTGQAVTSVELYAEAKARGISERTLMRAKSLLNVPHNYIDRPGPGSQGVEWGPLDEE